MIKVLLDTSPLTSGHATRGIGIYTKYLFAQLKRISGLEIWQSSRLKDQAHFKPDIIHYPYFDLFFDTLPLKKIAKTVVTVHDVNPLIFPKQYPAGIKGKLRFLKQKKALQRTDAVLTDSNASKFDIIKHLKIAEEKIYITYLAANPEIKKPSITAIDKIKQKHQLPSHFVLYVGDINYNKNIPQLIKSLKFLPNEIKLVCVGKNFTEATIPEWQWIESQIAASQVENRIKFINNIAGDALEELSAIYTAASIYVQPSLYEGFGLPVLEAMQCYTPVVASKNSSLIEVGSEYVEFCREDAESIAESINIVLNWSSKKRAQRVKAAYTWSQSFSWQKTAQKTFEVYQKILNQHEIN